jgi:hypothetical protein
VSDWAGIFLGVIALATLTTAVVQVAILVVAGRLARRVERLADRVEADLKPLFGHLDAIGRDTARAAALAANQVERADRLFADTVHRVDETLATIQASVIGPVREGAALVSGIRAALMAVRERRASRARSRRSEEEDALFI